MKSMAMGCKIHGSKTEKSKKFFSAPKYLDWWCWGSSSLIFTGYQDSSPCVKLMRHEVNQSLPSKAKIKNE